MSRAAVCGFLAIVGAFSTMIQGSRVLDAPTNLSVGFEDQYTAVLFWEFTAPEGTNLSEIEFVLALDGRSDSTVQFKIKAWRTPFHYKFKYLTPNSKYALKIWATSPTLGNSPPTETYFTTMARDWPTPSITNVTARRSWENMRYTVSWELSSRPVELSYFDVVLCSLECETMRTRSSDFDITFPISFYTEFSLNVIAFYDAGVAAMIARKSSEYQGMSEMGAPSKVQNITYIYQLGNKFRIDWLPSDPANGPLNYHEVYIYDPNHPASISGVTVTSGLSANLFAPQLAGDLYKIQITAVNVDPEGYHYRSRIAVFSHERILPSGSPTVEIIHRNSSSIHLRIIAEHPQEHLRFDVVSRSQWIRLFNKPDEIEVSGTNPYALVPMDLRTCYATSHLSIHTCGYFTHFNLTSNVKAPSSVEGLKISFTSHMRLIAEWNLPSTPNGPIDGYVMNVTEGLRDAKNGTKQRAGAQNLRFYIPSPTRRVEFRPPSHWRSLTLGIAAMNTDLDNKAVEYVGPTVYESLQIWEEETIKLTPWDRFAAFWFFWLIVFGSVSWVMYEVFDHVVWPLITGQPLALDVILGAPDALRGDQLDVDLLQGVPDRQRD